MEDATATEMGYPIEADNGAKRSRLESVIGKITRNIDYSFKFNMCVINKLQSDLKSNKNAAIEYMRSCFNDILEDDNFLKWLSGAVGLKPYRLGMLLSENQPNKRNSKLPQSCHQDIYNVWLQKSITSTDSTNNLKNLSKKTILQQYKGMVDENLREKIVQLKNGLKVMYQANKMIYIESIRKLCSEYNTLNVPVSLATFFRFKPFYCVLPSEKEKQSCVCINCQNPHLLLEAINRYRTSKHLMPHGSLTTYLQELKSGKEFTELDINISYTYHKYERVSESYTKKDGTVGEYKRITRVDHNEPIKDICNIIMEAGDSYLKHRTYVDNVSATFP